MSNDQQIQNILNPEDFEEKKIPSFLNVLTILTYVGCGLTVLSAIYNYFSVCQLADQLASKEMPQVGGIIGKMMESAVEMSVKQCDNRLVILVSTIASTLICFFGAYLMRQLKKQGFIIYTIGELIGPASMMVVLGMSSMGGAMIFGLVMNVVFVILYASQRNFLIH